MFDFILEEKIRELNERFKTYVDAQTIVNKQFLELLNDFNDRIKLLEKKNAI